MRRRSRSTFLRPTADGLFFLVEVKSWSSMHGIRKPALDRSRNEYRWPVEASVRRAVAEVNLPVVLFVIDADSETGYYARLDRLPRPNGDEKTLFIPLTPERDLSPQSIQALVGELRQESAASQRLA
jgi:hypothetical protein